MIVRRIATCVIVVLLVTAGVFWFTHRGSSTSDDEPASAPASPSATPPHNPSTTDQISTPPSSTSVADPVTENPLRVTKRSPFTDLVVEYEEINALPDSPNKEARLAKIATQRYLTNYRPPADEIVKGGDVITYISRDLTKTQLTLSGSSSDPNVRYVGLVPMMQTTRKDASGKESVVMPWTLLSNTPPDATTWVLQKGAWKIDAKR